MKRFKFFFLTVFIFSFTQSYASDPFSESSFNLDVGSPGKVSWADFNKDGYLDFFFFSSSENSSFLKIYINDKAGGFYPLNYNFPQILSGSFYITDFNNNGLIDIILNGKISGSNTVILLQNIAGEFFEQVPLNISGTIFGSVVAEDLNNDGRKDLLITGLKNIVTPKAEIYFQKKNFLFYLSDINLVPVFKSTVNVYDIDNNGEPDIFLSGQTDCSPGNNTIESFIYSNVNGVFVQREINIPGFAMSTSDWGDYNNDGLGDLIITGQTESETLNHSSVKTKIFKNNGNFNFSDINANLSSFVIGNVQWGDFDNDGRSDVFISGKRPYGASGDNINIFRNNSVSFLPVVNQTLNSFEYTYGGWGDFDNDGDLDIVYVSDNQNTNASVKLLINNSESIVNIPIEPNGLTTTVEFNNEVDGMILKWNYPTEMQNHGYGMSFNVRIGTYPGGSDILSPNSNTETGKLLIPRAGNAGNSTRWIIKNLPVGKYYWSVQTVDQAFQGSPFAEEQTFEITASTSVRQISDVFPDDFKLSQNFPNPFNPVTTIRFSVPDRSPVSLKIYNSLGKLVSEIVNETLNPGEYEVTWAGADAYGSVQPSGVYFYNITNGKNSVTKKMMLVK